VEIRDAVKRSLFGSKYLYMSNQDEEKRDIYNIGEQKFPPLPTWNVEESIDGCGTGGYEEYMPMMK